MALTIVPSFTLGLEFWLHRPSQPEPETFSTESAAWLFATSMAWLVPAGLVILASPEGPRAFGVRKPRWAMDFGLGVCGMLVCLAAWHALAPIFRHLHAVPAFRRDESPIHDGGDAVLFFFVTTLGCFAEELNCRAFLQTRLTQLLGLPLGVASSVALFSCVHVWMGPVGLATAVILGLVFSLLFRISRSIWPGFVAHLLWNIAALLL